MIENKDCWRMNPDVPFTLKLIGGVQRRPCLWNPKCKSYGKRGVFETAWREVSQEVGRPMAIVKHKWRNIRTAFQRSLRYAASKPGVTKRFYLHDAMSFMLPHMVRGSYSTLDDDQPALTVVKVETLDILSPETKMMNPPAQVICDPLKKKRYDNSGAGDSGNCKTEADLEKENDTIMAFFRGIAPDVLSLSPKNRRAFKRKLMEVIEELYADEEEQKAECPDGSYHELKS